MGGWCSIRAVGLSGYVHGNRNPKVCSIGRKHPNLGPSLSASHLLDMENNQRQNCYLKHSLENPYLFTDLWHHVSKGTILTSFDTSPWWLQPTQLTPVNLRSCHQACDKKPRGASERKMGLVKVSIASVRREGIQETQRILQHLSLTGDPLPGLCPAMGCLGWQGRNTTEDGYFYSHFTECPESHGYWWTELTSHSRHWAPNSIMSLVGHIGSRSTMSGS